MPWTRRDFLASSVVGVIGGALGRTSAARAWQQQPPPIHAVFTPVRRNVGVFTGRGGTIGYLLNPTGVVVVDSQYPEGAKLCIDGLNERSGSRPIDVLVNTHHHADHTGGNVAFKAVTRKIVAQANVPQLQRQANAQATTPAEQVYADTTFADRWDTRMGDEAVHAAYYAPAHTGGDAVVYFEQANVVHVGDLVFNRLQAFVDRPGGASATHWITMVERVATTYPSDAIYVFGHAGAKFQVTGNRADLLVMRDYLTALVEHVRSEIKAGSSRDEIIASTAVLTGFEDYGPLTSRALAGTYDEVAGS